MADARLAKSTEAEIKAGANKEYWINQYKKSNSEYEKNKALVGSHQGAKDWDEFKQRDQSRVGDVKSQNEGTIADYGKFTNYMTAKQGMDTWEKASAQYRN
jgi:hypothetical protein